MTVSEEVESYEGSSTLNPEPSIGGRRRRQNKSQKRGGKKQRRSQKRQNMHGGEGEEFEHEEEKYMQNIFFPLTRKIKIMGGQ